MNKAKLLSVTKTSVTKVWQRGQKMFYTEKKSVAEGTMGSRWKERESAQESAYFNREDEQAVQRLAAKLRQQIEPSEEILAQQRRGVAEILQKHGVQPNQSLIEDLVRFFH
ncbi:uncharacterized protein Gasu_13730 [Galdieria sulphuraria]|uniref:Uncharacterized protein n=1 Tax=Galdieria sulphuraria TaxID=130081 RepID=M2Y6D6_GALSU|nr:uncharacterized protein Gasu_13730 [Galdieria sulphuraria]EME31409.1 hypothetical protein Gasu_13730 [Galdieria sulphuraria]|eukprot:XP_005707929.1 hypothetical protein Gasu_13730 [Galdieria sulphuraria]